MRSIRWAGAAVLACALVSTPAPAGGEQSQEVRGSDELQQAMEQMMKLGEPGEHHRHLARMAGEWTYTATFYMPGGAMETTGTMSARTILGGRYVRAEWRGEFMGRPFVGIGTEGYDSVRHRHVSVWMDNMSTQVLHYSGTCRDGGKTVTVEGEMTDPMSGETFMDVGTTTWVDGDTVKMVSHRVMPDGQKMKAMEIVLKRK